MKYQLFGPCRMAIDGEMPPTYHSQCLGELTGLRCNCYCHPWAAKETTNDEGS